MSGYEVCDRQCDECLFTPSRVVSPAAMVDVLRQCRVRPFYDGPYRGDEKDFECHKGTIAGRKIVCRGFFDRYPDHSQAQQIARRLGLIDFVPPPERED